jgi:hypothetical protein
MRVWRVLALMAMVLATGGMHWLLPLSKGPGTTCPSAYDFNGGYRGRFHVDPAPANARPWGEWLEVTFSHTLIELKNCQPMPGKTHPITGKLDFRHLFGAPFETFNFQGSVNLGQPQIVTGAISKPTVPPSEIMPIKFRLFQAQRMGATLCGKMPGVAKQPGLSGSYVWYLDIEVLGPPNAVRKATLEKCWT